MSYKDVFTIRSLYEPYYFMPVFLCDTPRVFHTHLGIFIGKIWIDEGNILWEYS